MIFPHTMLNICKKKKKNHVLLTLAIGVEPILPARRPITINTMIKLDGDGDGDIVVMCEQAFNIPTTLVG